MARDDPKFIVRLPDGMRDRIAEAARANGRSMNAEIVHRLEQSFEQRFINDTMALEIAVLSDTVQRLNGVLRMLDPGRFKEVAPGVFQFSLAPAADAPPSPPRKKRR